jgi:5-(carboxyamino)imidazole ribonucleotide synthase
VAKYRVGILGGGQLARMSIMAAQRLGISAISLDEDAKSPAAQVGNYSIGSIHSAEDISRLMKQCEAITFENEFIRASTLREACQLADFDASKIIPGIDTLEIVQDKLLQRRSYLAANVPTPLAVESENAKAEIGFPCVLKARYGGYDGKGTRFARDESEYRALESLWIQGGWLAEQYVSFTRELAVMVVATQQGEYRTFPAVVTEQENHVCDVVYPCTDVNTCRRDCS